MPHSRCTLLDRRSEAETAVRANFSMCSGRAGLGGRPLGCETSEEATDVGAVAREGLCHTNEAALWPLPPSRVAFVSDPGPQAPRSGFPYSRNLWLLLYRDVSAPQQVSWSPRNPPGPRAGSRCRSGAGWIWWEMSGKPTHARPEYAARSAAQGLRRHDSACCYGVPSPGGASRHKRAFLASAATT